jgi:hypothetical protein
MLWALLACTEPCAERPRFGDPHDLARAGMLEAIEERWDEWTSWTRVDDLCISTVQVAEVEDGIGALTQDDDRITIDPAANDPGGALETQLCRALYRERGYAWAPPALFGSEDAFAAQCAAQPEGLGYFRLGEPVCGDRFETEQDRFFAEELFVDYSPRDDGRLGVVPGEAHAMALSGDGDWRSFQWVPIGDRLAVLRVAGLEVAVDWVDLAAGTVERGVELEVGAYDVVRLFGGLDEGAIWWEHADFTTSLAALRPGEAASWIAVPDPGWAYQGVVNEGALYATGGVFGAIESYALADGVRSDPTLPAIESAAPEILAGALHAAPGAVLAELYEAEIESSKDTVSVGIYRETLDRLDCESRTWTELTSTPDFAGSALAPEGVIVGRTYGGYPLLGAYEASSDRFLLADDLCLEDGDDVQLVGGAAWRITVADDQVTAARLDLAL